MSEKRRNFFRRIGLNEESGSVFLLAGILLVFACVLEIFRILYFSPRLDDSMVKKEEPEALQQAEASPKLKGNIFEELHTKYPGYKPPIKDIQKENVVRYLHNPILGNRRSDIVLTVFTDMNCTSCRQELSYTLESVKGYLDRIQVVVKYYPVNANMLEAGIFDQVARRAGVFPQYFWQMLKKNKQVNTDDYLFTLEKSGTSLTRLRVLMGDEMPRMMDNLQKDMDQAEYLGIHKLRGLPVFYLDGYRLGQHYLPQHRLTDYIDQILETGKLGSAE